MARLEKELREYAEELAQYNDLGYTVDEYIELLQGIYEATVRHHGEETIGQMSDATLVKVIRSQVGELIRLKRIHKLMKKRDRI